MSLVRNDETSDVQPSVAELAQSLSAVAKRVESFARACDLDFKSFELELRTLIWEFARLAVAVFLAARQEREAVPARVERADRVFRAGLPQARNLNTFFGVVRYWRTYLREVVPAGERHGFYPLDLALGLSGDRISFNLLAVAARLALKLSFAEARETLGLFVPNPPSIEVVEKTVLGLGRYTPTWFEAAPAPEGDGEVLVIQADSKGAPTATKSELSRRRGKRKKRGHRCKGCRRHRGRDRRRRYPKKPRRKKGDKSKNAKMATMVVMYTLRRDKGGKLHGPINVWRYASFAPKRHAFAIARREAEKRGFGPESKKRVQLVTDGDNDLAVYAKEYLPHALHSIDVMHVIEKLWIAGESLYKEARLRASPGSRSKRTTSTAVAPRRSSRICNGGSTKHRRLALGTRASASGSTQ